MKYSNELLKEAVAASVSMYDVLRFIGSNVNSGSMHIHISKRIKRLGLDTAHFLGVRANCGEKHKGGFQKRTAESLLVDGKTYREKPARLRRALLEIGVPEECATCGLLPIWCGLPLRLQVDHQNGNELDDTPGNVRFLCPNCHAQTANFSKVKTAWKGGKPPKVGG